ncbi:MAG: hypothetical protein ACLGHT_09740 [Acidimicrobiia bacterium]
MYDTVLPALVRRALPPPRLPEEPLGADPPPQDDEDLGGLYEEYEE